MPTPAGNGTPHDAGRSDRPSVGQAAKQVAEHASALARLELELASLELKRKAGSLGAGAALGGAAALVGLYAVGFLFATIAVALSLVLDLWLALLVVTLVLLLAAGGLAFAALRLVKRGSPPVPERALAEAKKTGEALKGDGARGTA